MASKKVKYSWDRTTRQIESGMIGIADGQTARISVVNTDNVVNLDSSAYVSPLVLVAGWTNPRSERLAQSAFTLLPGESAFLDLNRDKIRGHGKGRLQLRASVAVFDNLNSDLHVTVEVFDNETGRTALYVSVGGASL